MIRSVGLQLIRLILRVLTEILLLRILVFLVVFFLLLISLRCVTLHLVRKSTVHASVRLLGLRIVRAAELCLLHLWRKFLLTVHVFMIHMLVMQMHLALHVSHLGQIIDLLLHLCDLRRLVVAYHVRIHLLHWLRELHAHGHHLRRHCRILHRVLRHHGVLHELVLVLLALNFLHLLSFPLVHQRLIGAEGASLHRSESRVCLFKLHITALEGRASLLKALRRLMVTEVSSQFFVREDRAVLLVWSNKRVVYDALLLVAHGLGWPCSFLEQLLSCSRSQWIPVRIHPRILWFKVLINK